MPIRRPDCRKWACLALLALAEAAAGHAGETWGLVGTSYGAFRYHPRKIFLSLELDHRLGDGPFGLWGALEGKEGTGQFIGAGPLLVGSPAPGWMWAAGSGPGYYHRQTGLDLGYQLEFRSSCYVARRLGPAGWVGLSLSHYSNAHLRPSNPGAETLRVFWSMPLPWGRRRNP